MLDTPARARPSGGRLLENIMHFCRVLRAAGLPVGPGQTLKAIEAVRAIELHDREQFYWALHAALVNRRDQREVFDQAFHVFWRNPRILDRMMGMLLPDVEIGKHTSELQSLMRSSYAVFCLKKKKKNQNH